MRKLAVAGTIGCLLAAFLLMTGASSAADDNGNTKIAHMVFFGLKDNSAPAKAKLVEACKKYLTKHKGALAFQAGTRDTSLARSVNDVNFDVMLEIVFENKDAYTGYETSARHKQFIGENRANWKNVRVFDSVIGK